MTQPTPADLLRLVINRRRMANELPVVSDADPMTRGETYNAMIELANTATRHHWIEEWRKMQNEEPQCHTS